MKYPDILSITPEPGPFDYDDKLTIFYALALGAGDRPEDLSLVYEKQLRALPTLAVLMASGACDFINGDELAFARIVHGEQRLAIHRPLLAKGRMISTARCLSVIDKGADKGTLLNVDAKTGEPYATSIMTLFCRGDGGFGGATDGDLPRHPVPERPHDVEVVLQTLPQQAALYRLLADRNPLHIDPAVATAAGFDRPILHGLCSYGIACRAILQACCGNDPAMIERFDARMSAPVYPGEPIVTRIWRDGREVSFECHVAERGATVLRDGLCLLREL